MIIQIYLYNLYFSSFYSLCDKSK